MNHSVYLYIEIAPDEKLTRSNHIKSKRKPSDFRLRLLRLIAKRKISSRLSDSANYYQRTGLKVLQTQISFFRIRHICHFTS